MRVEIVLMAGKKRTGKNTAATAAADYLSKQWWHTYSMAFADELRRELTLLNPQIGISAYTGRMTRWQDVVKRYGYEEAKEKFPEMRRLQQVYGTEVRRAEDKDVWCRHVERKIRQIMDIAQPAQKIAIFVTDLRFENELRYIAKQFPVSVIYTTRPIDTKDSHASEDLSWLDRWIENPPILTGPADSVVIHRIHADSIEAVKAAAVVWAKKEAAR